MTLWLYLLSVFPLLIEHRWIPLGQMHVRIHLYLLSVESRIDCFCGFCFAHFVCTLSTGVQLTKDTCGNWKLSVGSFNEDLHRLPSTILSVFTYFVSTWNTNENGSLLRIPFFHLWNEKKNLKITRVYRLRVGCVTTLIYFYHFKEFTRMFLLLFRLFDEYMCNIECSFFCVAASAFNDSMWMRERASEQARMILRPAVSIITGYNTHTVRMEWKCVYFNCTQIKLVLISI